MSNVIDATASLAKLEKLLIRHLPDYVKTEVKDALANLVALLRTERMHEHDRLWCEAIIMHCNTDQMANITTHVINRLNELDNG